MVAQHTLLTCGVIRKLDLLKAFVRIDRSRKVRSFFMQKFEAPGINHTPELETVT